LLLVLQASFGSWRLGAAFFLVLPLAVVGGVLAGLALAGATTTGTALGLVVVLGLAARNGILLVKRGQALERTGQPFGPALVVQAARQRLAPTLVTAVATALAFLPFVVLGGGPGHELLHPMGIVVLGGLITSTAVSLLALPVLYLAFGGTRTDTELDVARFEAELVDVGANGELADRATPATPGVDRSA
jgi:multidrug efflux pump subunit AcrB